MDQHDLKCFTGPVIQDRRGWISLAPPYLTEAGIVSIDRRGAVMVFGPYAYRTWVEIDSSRPIPWEAWHEVYALDCRTLLSGPTKLDQQFVTPEGASAAAAQKVKWEILNMIGNRVPPKTHQPRPKDKGVRRFKPQR